MWRPGFTATMLGLLMLLGRGADGAAPRVELKCDDAQGQMQILIDGAEALAYQYGAQCDMPHYYPVHSPTGKLLTVQQTTPYPHHRSFWFADTIQFADGPKTSFYSAMYSALDKKDPKSPLKTQIQHVKFLARESTPQGAKVEAQLVWVTDQGKTPMLDEVRTMRVVPLGAGEYLLDCTFVVTAAYADVTFASDATHYAWPYVRIHPQFSAKDGKGQLTNSEGTTGEKGTMKQAARWVDFSGEVEGVTEGLTIFSDPQQPQPRFFTRDYGTFGPRRPDEQSGKPFVLAKGQSLRQRVGILVHKGDVSGGQVAKRYQAFAEGKL